MYPQSLLSQITRLITQPARRPSATRRGRGARLAQLEQLEARRVMAQAVLESMSLADPNYELEQSVVQSTQLNGEGEDSGPKVFYYSPSISGYVKNSNHSALFVDDSDIVKLSIFSSHSWKHEIYFDGSDVGLSTDGENVDAFAIRPDGSLLFSTTGQTNVPGLRAETEDLMLFRPTTLGSQTAGSWEMFFDGSDVGLSNWEGLDGVSVLPDGRLIISTQRTAQVSGLSGSFQAEDLLQFTPITTGSNTSGTWAHFFDGSDVYVNGILENVDGVSVDKNGTTIHLSTTSLFCVPGLIGFGRDIFTFQSTRLGTHTRGSFDSPLTLNGSRFGLLFNSINAIEVPSQAVANQPPVINAISAPTIPELAPFARQLSANDPDTPASQLTWSLVSGPSGSGLSNTGLFTWTPTEAQGPGQFPVVVAVSDGLASAQATFTVAVMEVNQPPVIGPLASPTIQENTTYNALLAVSDPDAPANTLTWSLVSAPGGAALNSATGRFAWRPTEVQGPGVFPIVVAVTDGSATTEATFTITVTEFNQAPTIAPITSTTIPENETYNLQLAASDPDLPANTLTWSLVSGPGGAALNPATRRFAWRPTEVQGPGVFPIVVAVTDGSATTEATFTITVAEVNQAPVLSPIQNQTVNLNQTFSLLASASDPDLPANTLTYSLINAPSGATINGQTGQINWLANQSGAVPFTVSVSDAGGLTSTQTFTLNVIGMELRELDNFASELVQSFTLSNNSSALRIELQTPEFDGSSIGEIRDAFEIELMDLNGNKLVLPYGVGAEASFNWTEGLAPVSAAGVTTSIASSGEQSSVTINLNGLAAGTQFQLRMRLVNNDSDNNTIVRITNVSLIDSSVAAPLGASISPASTASGSVDFANLQDVTGSFAVSYGRSTLAGTNDRLLVDVQLQNQSAQALRGPLLLVVKNVSSLDVNALRPDGLTPAGHPYFRLEFTGEALVTGQSTLGRQVGFLNPTNERFDYALQILAATDAAPSSFTSVPVTSIEAGDQYRYQAQASDADGDVITYSLVRGPAAASIDAATGLLTWNTASGDVGLHRLTLRATDSFGAFTEQTFDLQVLVTLQNRPPLFVSDPVTDAIASSGFEVTTVATGDQPVGVSVISGFQGPRLVSINAGDQSLSVHAGQNNDRFDHKTIYSSGEPRPTGALIDVGYSVDVGLPPFLVNSDRNEMLAMDQGDLNGDGILDLVVITARNETTKPSQRVTIEMTRMLGDGDGNFSEPSVIASIPSTTYSELFRQATNLRIADLDGDGNLDVVALQKTTPRLITVRGLGDGSFAPVVFTTLATALNDFRVEDLDQDGTLDIIGRNANISDLGWMRGTGDGTFAPFVRLAVGGGFWFSSFASYAPRPYSVIDIDSDGDLDIVNSETDGGNIVVWLNDGSQNFTVGTTLDPPGGEGTYALHVGDFNGDGRLDILAVNPNETIDLFVRGPSGLTFERQTQVDRYVWGRSGNLAGIDAPLDIDGDGDLDLILASSFDFDFLSPQVLINDGTGRFDRTDYQMVDFPGHIVATATTNRDVVRGVMLGDYNRDGVMDFSYMTSSYLGYDFHGVGIRLGTRPGEFGATRTVSGISLNRNDTEVYAADFNGDGNVDLLSLLNARMSLGNGDGTFQPAFPATSILGASTSGVVADFNLDGIPDYAATRGTGSGTKLYIAKGSGDGTFASALGPDTPGMFYGYSDIRTADFNNDGWPDLIAKANVERNIDIFLNDPTNPGTFTRPFRTVQEVTGVNATGFDHTITTGDFNGDGNIDFVTVDQLTGTPFNSSGNPLKLQTFAGDGTGNFTITNETFAFDDAMFTEFNFYYPYILQSGDVNSDGNLDIVSFSPLGFIIHLGDGSGSFTSIDRYDFERIPGFTKAGWLVDYDQDGVLDIVYNHAEETLSIRRGNGDGTFAPPQRVGTHAVGGSLTFADFDNDGHLDIATSRAAGDLRPADVGFYYGTRDGLVDQLAVDLDGDGNEEVLAINEANDRLKIFTGDNLDGLQRRDDLLTGRAPQAVATGDLNSDGRREIITANRTGRSITVFSGSLASGFTSTEVLVGSAPIDVLTRDINGDGHTDVLVLDDVANAVWFLSGSASGALSTPTAIALGDTPGKFTVADATGDGVLDAVITLPNSNRLMIVPSLGVQPASPPIYVSVISSPSDIQVTDLNADGNPDLATTLPGSNVLSILYGRGNNQFAQAQNIAVGQEPTGLTLADADEDGRMDLIVANSGDDTASVIYNHFDPNEVYRYDADAIDPDNDSLTYSIVDGPGGLIINSQTGALLWAASPDQVGEHTVTISADDGRGGSATQSFKIDVQPARDNALPLIATEPNTRIGAGETFTYQATAIDNDRDTLRYSLIDAPPGASIDPTTGKVTWDARADLALSFAPHGSGNGFDSRGTVAVEAHPSLRPASLTAEGWYNFTSLPANNQFSNIIYQAGFGNQTAYALYNSGNSNLRLELDYPSPINRFVYNVPFVPQTNRWYHFAITIDDSTRVAKIFVDGVERGSTTLPGSIVYNPAANAQVGDGGLFFTRAIIDNYRLWNVARTPAEIAEGLSRQYDGDTRVVLDYRFDEPQTLTVRDFSPAGNYGYRKGSGILPVYVPGLAQTGNHAFTIGVEDGRGGFDQQSFTLEILPELRGSIRGQAFSDLDGSGGRNGSEPIMAGVHLFLDSNGNDYPDPSESQTITDANGNYQFNGLLPGDYRVRVSSRSGYQTPAFDNVSVTPNINSVVDLALEQLALGQIRGQLLTEGLTPIGYWSVFADLDNNGQLDAGEPTTLSDRDGNFGLSGLSAGSYTVRTELPPGWSIATGTNGQNVTLAAGAISANNNFVLEATNASVTSGLRFVTSPTLTLQARQTFRYASVAIGIQPESIRYDLSLAPAGMSIDPATGLIVWRPTIAQIGEHLVIVRATGASGSIALQDFRLNVSAPNIPPVLTTELPSTAYVGLVYAVDLMAQDAESQTITYNLLSGPSTAALDAITGQLRWTPSLADVGNAAFSIELRDSNGGTSIVNATIAVVNAQPSVTPFSVTLPRAEVGLGQEYLARIRGTDALGRPLTWSRITGPVGLLVSANGSLNWTPSNNDLGSRSIVLQATSVDGTTSNSSFTLEVAGRAVNTAPSIVSTPIVSTTLGKEYQYNVQAVDANADALSFALINAPVGMSIHPSLGIILWTPALDQLGESDVTVEVSDPDGATATQVFKVKVSKSGGPPAIASTPHTEAAVGVGYLYSIVARDAEGDPLNYRLLVAPTGMTIAQTTGVISWTPQANQVGQQDVVIEVSDGIGGAVTQAFAIRVSNGAPNLPPVITSTAPRFGVVGATYNYALQATDPESTAVTYTLAQAPAGMTINSTTGLVAWTPAVGQVGRFVVTLIATDAGGASAIESFELDVLAANSLPTIISAAPLEVAAGALFAYQVLARDTDLDQLSYELTTAPAGAAIDGFGKISWPTSPALIGTHNFSVRVSDPRGGVATQSFTLSVIEDVIAPKLSLIESLGDANRNVLPWQGPFIVFVKAIDNVGIASLTLTANGQDISLSASGTATFTFEDWAFQSINATATAIDTNGNVTTKTITFDYDFPEGWSGAGVGDIPTVAITSPTESATVYGMVAINGTAAHANLASYKLLYRRIDETVFTQFFESSAAVVDGQLGIWDTSLLINDEYVIRLEAVSNSGVVNVLERTVGLSGELKLGNFQLAFTDMVVPLAGIPIEVTRIYDSLQANREGDFGYGWRLEYRDTDLRVGLPKSGLEDIGIYSPLVSGVKVYLNVPGQGRLGFTFTPEIRVLPGFGDNLVLARPRFTADPGVTASLSAGVSGYLFVNERGELYASGDIPYNPASPYFGGAFVLTTSEGFTYRVDGSSGKLVSASDLNGNRVEFTDDRIQASNGAAVLFTRDVQGRIKTITDAQGGILTYEYLNGDLVKVVDRIGTETRLRYSVDRAHFLEEVIDPLGRPVLRNEYDESGRLIGQENPTHGKSLTIQSQFAPGVSRFIYPDGTEEFIRYDSLGRVVQTTDALGRSVSQEFDTFGVSKIIDAQGGVKQFQRDPSGRIIREIKEDGSSILRTYDGRGNLSSVTNELGEVALHVYDQRNNLLSSQFAGSTTSFEYDNSGALVKIIDSEGGITEHKRNSLGYIIETTAANGLVLAFERNSLGLETAQTATVTDNTGAQREVSVRRTYDANGNETSITDAQGRRVDQFFDELGNMNRVQDDDGRSLAIDHKGTSLVHDIRYANGSTAAYVYGDRNQVTEIRDNLGKVTKLSYNAVGDLIARILPDNTPETDDDNPRFLYSYDELRRPVATTDPTGVTVTQLFDARGRVVQRASSDGTSTRFEYDAAGRLVSTTNALNQTTRFILDDRGNTLETHFSDGTRSTSTYDSLDRVIARTNEAGERELFEYDASGKLTGVIDANGLRTGLVRNQFGDIIGRIDAAGNETSYSFTELAQLNKIIKPDASVATREYGADGKITKEVNYSGETTLYIYDANGNLSEKRYADGSSTTFSYNAFGTLNQITDTLGVINQTINNNGQLQNWNGADGSQLSYEYDSSGRRTATTLDGQRTEFVYEQGRLVSITRNSQSITNRTYDSLGNLVSERFANGITELRGYDNRSQLTRLTVLNSANVIVKEFLYSYDPAGRLVREEESTGEVRSYNYDSDGQLVKYMLTNGSAVQEAHSYEYDATGNMTRAIKNGVETRWVFDSTSRLVSQTRNGVTTAYSYDANGNLLAAVEGGVEIFRYTWDARGRLISVRTIENGSVSNVQYIYDYAGLMTRRVVNGVATDYLYDRSGALPKLVRSTVNGVHEYYTHAERILSRTAAGTESFYHLDAAGNTRFQTSAEAQVGSQLSYVPFGELSGTSAALQAEGQAPFQFAGELFDPVTNLTYLRQRHYKPSLARFVSTDVFHGFEEEPLSQNPYQYAYNSPLMFKDPSGEWVPSIAELKVAGSIAVTLGALAGVQVLAGSGGLRGNEIKYAGPFLSFGFGVGAGIGFGVDFYAGLLGSSESYVGGPGSKSGYRLSGGAGFTLGLTAGFSANFGGNAGGVKVALILNPVTRYLGGSALSGAMVIGDISVQLGAGTSPKAFMTLGFGKGYQSGGSSLGLAAGAAASIKMGLYAAGSVAVDEADSLYVISLGDKITSTQFNTLFDQTYAKYF